MFSPDLRTLATRLILADIKSGIIRDRDGIEQDRLIIPFDQESKLMISIMSTHAMAWTLAPWLWGPLYCSLHATAKSAAMAEWRRLPGRRRPPELERLRAKHRAPLLEGSSFIQEELQYHFGEGEVFLVEFFGDLKMRHYGTAGEEARRREAAAIALALSRVVESRGLDGVVVWGRSTISFPRATDYHPDFLVKWSAPHAFVHIYKTRRNRP